ncbi:MULTISPECIES: peptidase M23 [Thioclava]|uniref:peptidase M23 n=1 Tax=Thioclava TaxID=285107 RepID=UPI000C53E626|nr:MULTISPECIES: peptidase M23 [Thioclava]MAQ37445.1 peptidase M23 [Thioclava sp.]|tara:strand:+ start:155 stop:319 length:165 start_codon:yes stop_codon:yes gene_type:complete
MKKTFATLLGALAASPALAHSGTHFHTHGVEPMLIVGVAALAVYGIVEFVRSHR